MCKNASSYEHKKNRNRAVARFRFLVVNTKKGTCCVLFQSLYLTALNRDLRTLRHSFFLHALFLL